MPMPTQAEMMLAPTTGGTRDATAIAGAGASAAAGPFEVGKFATVVNNDSSVPLAVRFDGSSPTAVTTDLWVHAGAPFNWMVTEATKYVAGIASDGSSTSNGHAWQSSEI